MTKKITLRMLKAKGACIEQCERFAALFPKGVEVTEVLCIEHAADFNWDWAAKNLLTAPAWAEYVRATAPAWAEYERVRAPASHLGRIRACHGSCFGRIQACQAKAFAKHYLEG